LAFASHLNVELAASTSCAGNLAQKIALNSADAGAHHIGYRPILPAAMELADLFAASSPLRHGGIFHCVESTRGLPSPRCSGLIYLVYQLSTTAPPLGMQTWQSQTQTNSPTNSHVQYLSIDRSLDSLAERCHTTLPCVDHRIFSCRSTFANCQYARAPGTTGRRPSCRRLFLSLSRRCRGPAKSSQGRPPKDG